MVKHELNERGYAKIEKKMNMALLRFLWAIFTVGSTASTFWLGWVLIVRDQDAESLASIEFSDLNVAIYLIIMVAALSLYFIITRLLMTLFCENKSTCISVRVKDTITFIPTSYCREALKPWQFIISYTVPLLVIYMLLFVWWYLSLEVASAFAIFLVMLFIMPDMVMVLYILYIMLTERPDYIAVDEHIIITVYKNTAKLKRAVNKR